MRFLIGPLSPLVFIREIVSASFGLSALELTLIFRHTFKFSLLAPIAVKFPFLTFLHSLNI